MFEPRLGKGDGNVIKEMLKEYGDSLTHDQASPQ
jgi:hypothetical protein